MHDKMMVTAGAKFRAILARGTVGFAWYAGSILHIYKKTKQNRVNVVQLSLSKLNPIKGLSLTLKVTIGTDLQTDCEIGDMQMGRRTGKTAVWSGAGTSFT